MFVKGMRQPNMMLDYRDKSHAGPGYTVFSPTILLHFQSVRPSRSSFVVTMSLVREMGEEEFLFLLAAVLFRNGLGTLQVSGMQRVSAFSPFLTCRPNSFHFGKVATGPGWMPRAKHWNKAKSWLPSENVNWRNMLSGVGGVC